MPFAQSRSPKDTVSPRFSVSYRTWQAFKRAARDRQVTVSHLLVELIEGYLSGETAASTPENEAIAATSDLETQLTQTVDRQLKEYNETWQERLNTLKGDLTHKMEVLEERLEIVSSEGNAPSLPINIDVLADVLTSLEENCRRLENRVDRLERDRRTQNTPPSKPIDIDVTAIPVDRPPQSPPKPKERGGLTEVQLCQKFGINPENVSRNASIRNVSNADYLNQLTGWICRQGKYYPPPESF